MIHRNILDAWVAYILDDWLDIRGKTQLHPSVEPLIKKLRQYAPEPKHKDDAWHCIEQIEKLCDQVHRGSYNVSSRMFLECGIAAYQMGNAHEAISFLSRSASSFIDDHDKGIAYWLLGCVYWYINNPVVALGSWEEGYSRFKEMNTKSGRGSKMELWYLNKTSEMEKAIRYAAENEAPPPPNRSSTKKRSSEEHTIQSLPVVGQIPAGTPLDILPTTGDFMGVNRVCINNKEYCIISLISGRKTINMHQKEKSYYLLRVSGNSMNQASPEAIENGDYVIMREEKTAINGDIVAALIIKDQGENEHLATLKRYLERSGKILLQPESTDPEFQKPVYAREFNKSGDEFQMRGVAIAVLKELS